MPWPTGGCGAEKKTTTDKQSNKRYYIQAKQIKLNQLLEEVTACRSVTGHEDATGPQMIFTSPHDEVWIELDASK